MLYSMNQIALYLNLASGRIKKDGGRLTYLTDTDSPVLAAAAGDGQETQILFVRDALWIANNDDQDSLLQQELLNKLGIKTPEQLIQHVETYQGRVFARIKIKGAYEYAEPDSPGKLALFELASRNEKGEPQAVAYPAPITVFPKAVANPKYTLVEPDGDGTKPPVAGIVFVVGNYAGANTGVNEHAEQKLLAALLHVPDSITGTLPLYGCKRQCAVCEGVFKKAIPRLKSRSRYLNCTAHDDRTVENYQQQAHPSNIKALDVDKYFPA